jgi:hypothetical protein
MITYFQINKIGKQRLISFLENILKNPENACRHADVIISEYDGSDIDSTQDVEIRGYYTKTNNPVIYTFSDDELNIIEIED